MLSLRPSLCSLLIGLFGSIELNAELSSMNGILTQLLGFSRWVRGVCSGMGMPLSVDILVSVEVRRDAGFNVGR